MQESIKPLGKRQDNYIIHVDDVGSKGMKNALVKHQHKKLARNCSKHMKANELLNLSGIWCERLEANGTHCNLLPYFACLHTLLSRKVEIVYGIFDWNF